MTPEGKAKALAVRALRRLLEQLEKDEAQVDRWHLAHPSGHRDGTIELALEVASGELAGEIRIVDTKPGSLSALYEKIGP